MKHLAVFLEVLMESAQANKIQLSYVQETHLPVNVYTLVDVNKLLSQRRSTKYFSAN